MPYAIAPSDVRERGRWTSDELSDTTLNSKGFIPAGQAWVNLRLTSLGLDYDNLSSDQKAAADAAGVAFVASRVMLEAARGKLEIGYMNLESVPPTELKEISRELYDEARQYLALLGDPEGGFYVSGSGHDTYEQTFQP